MWDVSTSSVKPLPVGANVGCVKVIGQTVATRSKCGMCQRHRSHRCHSEQVWDVSTSSVTPLPLGASVGCVIVNGHTVAGRSKCGVWQRHRSHRCHSEQMWGVATSSITPLPVGASVSCNTTVNVNVISHIIFPYFAAVDHVYQG